MSDLNREMNVNFDDKTRTFSVNYGEKETVKEILKFVYDSLTENIFFRKIQLMLLHITEQERLYKK